MKLSQVKYSDVLLNGNDFKKEMVFTKDYKKVDKAIDIGICFGGTSMIPHRADEAIKLYYDGLLKKILLTGGIGFLSMDRKIPEAYKLYNYCCKKGVPDSDLILEDKSRNTFENVKLFLKKLEEYYSDLNNITFVTITSDFHLRRCISMLKANLNNEQNIYGTGIKDGITDIDNWYNNFYGKRMIISEALMLSYYAKKGIITDEDVPNLEILSRKRLK